SCRQTRTLVFPASIASGAKAIISWDQTHRNSFGTFRTTVIFAITQFMPVLLWIFMEAEAIWSTILRLHLTPILPPSPSDSLVRTTSPSCPTGICGFA
ncbi:MAG TPA: hypothetical protein VGH38_30465, partial [Bryobacteraceae bacterium]